MELSVKQKGTTSRTYRKTNEEGDEEQCDHIERTIYCYSEWNVVISDYGWRTYGMDEIIVDRFCNV